MAICSSCGGLLGRDCFSPKECASISQNMDQENQQENQYLRQENEFLKQLLADNKIEIPETKREESNNNYFDDLEDIF